MNPSFLIGEIGREGAITKKANTSGKIFLHKDHACLFEYMKLRTHGKHPPGGIQEAVGSGTQEREKSLICMHRVTEALE